MSFFAGQTREQLRAAYRDAWRKARERLPLQPLEAQIADVVAVHPQYQDMLEADVVAMSDRPSPDGVENPFLHMGLHLALREQIGTDRPHGIAGVHRRLAATLKGAHEAEHRMIEVLAAVLWQAQRSGQAPQDADYLEQLRRL
jgi:hypothetical protein